MTQLLTLTPSEFIMAVYQGDLIPEMLSERGGLLTTYMREYYDCSHSVHNEFEVIIGISEEEKITISHKAAGWGSILDVAINRRIQGKAFGDVLRLVMKSNFEHYLKCNSEEFVSIYNLFDQVYNLIAYTNSMTEKRIH